MMLDNNKIFVVIPSATDFLILETIDRMIKKAKNPQNLHIVFSTECKDDQFLDLFDGMSQENALSSIDTSSVGSIKHIIINPNFINGPSSTRHHLYKFQTDEKYILSLDAHTSFGLNWDEKLIRLYEESSKVHFKPLISGWLECSITDRSIVDDLDKRVLDKSLCYLFNSESGEHKSKIINNRRYSRLSIEPNRMMFDMSPQPNQEKLIRKYIDVDDRSYSYVVKQIICAHFMFTSSEWIKDVGFSSIYTYTHEEPDISFRSYLNGYDIIEFDIQFLSNLSVANLTKDRSYANFEYERGLKNFEHTMLVTKENGFGRSFFTWLNDIGVITKSQEYSTPLDLDILKVIEVKNF